MKILELSLRDNHILFVHIPKTAGTSFRKAAEKYFLKENVYYDYGQNSVETSEIILNKIYKQEDMYALDNYFETKKQIFLSGHFHAAKYGTLFKTVNTIAFVRNPVEQVISHYNHHCRYLDYKESLETFVKDKRFKNIQSRILSGRPIELYGFIGLTEAYAKSIELINDYYDLNIEVLSENINEKKELTSKTINEEIRALIREENQEDILLYSKVENIFQERVKCYEENKQYIHVLIQEKTDKKIRGCAFYKTTDKAINVKIFSNSNLLDVVQTKSFRPGLLHYKLPRKGFVGFDYMLKNSNEKITHLSATLL